MLTERSRLSLRLGILVCGAALTAVVAGSPGPGAIAAALWLAGNLFWLHRRTQVMLGVVSGFGGWATTLRLLILAAGLWALLAFNIASALDVLIAVTWMYPGLVLSFLVHKNQEVKDDC